MADGSTAGWVSWDPTSRQSVSVECDRLFELGCGPVMTDVGCTHTAQNTAQMMTRVGYTSKHSTVPTSAVANCSNDALLCSDEDDVTLFA